MEEKPTTVDWDKIIDEIISVRPGIDHLSDIAADIAQIFLDTPPNKKILIIKGVRNVTDLNLAESKKLVERILVSGPLGLTGPDTNLEVEVSHLKNEIAELRSKLNLEYIKNDSFTTAYENLKILLSSVILPICGYDEDDKFWERPQVVQIILDQLEWTENVRNNLRC